MAYKLSIATSQFLGSKTRLGPIVKAFTDKIEKIKKMAIIFFIKTPYL